MIDVKVVTVVVVEDSQAIVERLTRLLGEIGEGVAVVGRARTGVEAVRAIERLRPDVVILDIRLAAGSGISVLREIKGDGVGGDRSRPAPVVVVLTNYSYAVYRKACLAAGADFFLDKSKEFDRVATVLRQMIRN